MGDLSPDEAAERISAVVSESLAELTTGWVLVASTITDDGQQATWYLSPPGQPSPQTLGQLMFGLAKQLGLDPD